MSHPIWQTHKLRRQACGSAVSIIKVNYSSAGVSEGKDKKRARQKRLWTEWSKRSAVNNQDWVKKASKQHLEEICLSDWWKQRRESVLCPPSSSSLLRLAARLAGRCEVTSVPEPDGCQGQTWGLRDIDGDTASVVWRRFRGKIRRSEARLHL